MSQERILFEVRKVVDAYEIKHGRQPNLVILPYNIFSMLKSEYIQGDIKNAPWTVFGIDVIVSEDKDARIQCLTVMK